MKKLLLTLVLVTVATMSLQAKIWRINNQPGVPADFTNGQDAHNAASAGDTLHFESSPTSYPGFTIRKQLTVMGTGSFLNNYPGYQIPGLVTASVNTPVSIKAGGDGTVITGIYIASYIAIDTVSNVKIFGSHAGGIYLTKASNTTIYKNYTQQIAIAYGSHATVVYNNMIGTISRNGAYSTSTSIFQNTVWGSISTDNASISNNIVLGGANLTNCNFSHNIIGTANYTNNSVTFTSGGNNLFSQTSANIFTLPAGMNSIDKYYELKSGSPAIGAASDGGDCGATGGASAYVFNSLQPAIPSIYKLVVPGVVTGSTMPITISTRANN